MSKNRESIALAILNYSVKHGVVQGALSSADAYPLADAILRALATRSSPEWQPITSAPKDGTAVWLWYDGAAYLGYFEAPDWLDADGKWFIKAGISKQPSKHDEIYGTYAHGVTPTLWQPVPQPPNCEQQVKENRE